MQYLLITHWHKVFFKVLCVMTNKLLQILQQFIKYINKSLYKLQIY